MAEFRERTETELFNRIKELEERVVARFEEVIADLKTQMKACVVRSQCLAQCGTQSSVAVRRGLSLAYTHAEDAV